MLLSVVIFYLPKGISLRFLIVWVSCKGFFSVFVYLKKYHCFTFIIERYLPYVQNSRLIGFFFPFFLFLAWGLGWVAGRLQCFQDVAPLSSLLYCFLQDICQVNLFSLHRTCFFFFFFSLATFKVLSLLLIQSNLIMLYVGILLKYFLNLFTELIGFVLFNIHQVGKNINFSVFEQPRPLWSLCLHIQVGQLTLFCGSLVIFSSLFFFPLLVFHCG